MLNSNLDSQTILRLENISLWTHNHQTPLLENISLSMSKGERLGILGSSGAGKTTLLKLLNYLHSPNQGKFFFQQESINVINPLELRTKIVLVPQEPKLLGMTVQCALTYPLQLQKLATTEITQRLSWCLNELSIPDSWLQRQELELSLGQRQLVAVARGIIMQPLILLLDEPTSALDTGKANWLKEKLINLSENLAITMIVVNHDLNWLKDFATRIVWLNQGKIKQDSIITKIHWQEIRENLLNTATDDFFEDF
ncbi:MAG: ATP-binding cassette domain-containing protein [Cyanobacteria bacterium]|nr:ATP-binding cassette domain-containing protein [Cyanobacteria bacterium CG_2015-16_32_12]NCQ05799.1 ATP-binding cassette domain-containing protein [Cyanobacteria bacterium CG_2015-09_32_10]NCQ42370.1 ATP-binding cassette domain-containing protein [Cyanobacteria bacterium CG_2015-04_32_10]